MKTYILIPLAVLYFASAALLQKKPYLLATVLFYNDGKGNQMVGAGYVPKQVKEAIRSDIESRVNKTTVVHAKVVPLFKRMVHLPSASEITGFVKETFKQVYLAKIPHWLASKVVYEKNKKRILSKVKNYKLDDLTKDNHNSDEAVNTNLISEGKFDEISSNNIAKVPKAYYVPNTVFYAVETKCITPNDYSCFLHKKIRHIKTPYCRTFKTIFNKLTSKDLQHACVG